MRTVARIACFLTILIAASSALIRRWQEGLGCDAWPACAALFRAPMDEVPAAIEFARLAHRVSASTVGVLVALLVLYGWQAFARTGRGAVLVAAGATLFLAWLGRYSSLASLPVTLGNVLGGTLLVAVLGWLASRGSVQDGGEEVSENSAAAGRGTAAMALLLLALAVASGVAFGKLHAWLAAGFVVVVLHPALTGGQARDRSKGVRAALVLALLVGLAGTGVAMAEDGSLPLIAATVHSALSAASAAWLGACLRQRLWVA